METSMGILGNRYGIHRENYVELLQGSKISARFQENEMFQVNRNEHILVA